GQRIDLLLVFARIGPQLDLGERLVGERRRHDEARVSHGIAEIHEPPFRQQDNAFAVRKFDFVDLRLDVVPAEILQRGDLYFAVEMADVAHDRAVFHLAHVVDGDDVEVTCGGNEDVRTRGGVFHGGDLVALHGSLEGADRVDLGHHHAAARL